MTQYHERPLLAGYEHGDWIRPELDADLDVGPLYVAAMDHRTWKAERFESHTIGYTLEGPDVWDAVNEIVDSEVLHARQHHKPGADEWAEPELFGTVWMLDGERVDAPEAEPTWKDIATITGITEGKGDE